MNTIKCPKCGEAFQIDEAGYAAILQQVRDEEFKKAVAENKRLCDESKVAAVQLAEGELKAELARVKAQLKAAEDGNAIAKKLAVEEAIRAEREAAAKAEEAKRVSPQKAEVSFEDFSAMDIRTATVLEAERVPKTDKLLKLTIDTGIDKRVIVSGIAEYYSPEDMLGKQICILANLAPRKIRGIESKGMILMARQGDGKMRFITPAEALNNGAEIG